MIIESLEKQSNDILLARNKAARELQALDLKYFVIRMLTKVLIEAKYSHSTETDKIDIKRTWLKDDKDKNTLLTEQIGFSIIQEIGSELGINVNIDENIIYFSVPVSLIIDTEDLDLSSKVEKSVVAHFSL